MLKPLLELFRVTEERADELFLMFLDGEHKYQDAIVWAVVTADLPVNEKMLLAYVMGVVSSIDIQEKAMFGSKKHYIH